MSNFAITIASGATTSNEVSVGFASNTFVGLETPHTFTTADLIFQKLGNKGANWKNIYNADGSQCKIAGAAANGYYSLNPSVFVGIDKIRIVSSVAQAQLTELSLTAEVI